MELLKKRWFRLGIFGVIGIAVGYAYYYYIGCMTGSCPLSSNPYIMMGYGLSAGLLLGWDNKKKSKTPIEETADAQR